MALFVALFFQVLFVFFAMAINVGMVVHDKINLQNSVDLAAYYGAMKQAEILNQIAHINYQMRQNYKLFVYRFRVLGSLGLKTHPYNSRSPLSSLGDEIPATGIIPSYCVAHSYWKEYASIDPNSNMCQTPKISLPNIPTFSGGVNFIPGINELVRRTELQRRIFVKNCNEAGVLNWRFAARMLAHYRSDGWVRKQMIQTLARKLIAPGSSMTDLKNESVFEGVEKTLKNNLTTSNGENVQIDFLNSLSLGPCGSVETWLPEVRINPVIRFTDFDGTSIEECRGEGIPNRTGVNRQLTQGAPGLGADNLPSGFQVPALRSRYLAPNQVLAEHWGGEPSGDFHSSIGFEKNPWCVIYSGVQASTQVRKPFSPTGGTLELKARGFAKPFGGRIGPWYGQTWPRGSKHSKSTNFREMTDPLLPSRDIEGSPPSPDPQRDLANHARFVGDNLGMNSLRALTSMVEKARNLIRQKQMAWSHYNHLGWPAALQETGDSLARDAPGLPAVQRQFELAATAPDAFDALYYSVEPSYFNNYFSPRTTNNGASLPANERVFDFGSSKDGSQNNSPQEFNIIQSIENGNRLFNPQVQNYFIHKWEHLLTSWHQGGAVDFGLTPGQFGNCRKAVTNSQFPTTGNCIVGGRTGYGVKNVSLDYLLSSDHKIGGNGVGAGPILNPPPSNF